MSYRLGSDAAGWIDLPATRDVTPKPQEVGSTFRGVTGRSNSYRTAVKREWQIPLRPFLSQATWGPIWDLWMSGPGPYFLMDTSAPNDLPDADALGSGWQTSAGVAIPAQRNMRLPTNGTFTSVQTAKTTTPVLGDLIPVTPTLPYTFAHTLYVPTAFVGLLAVYTYAGPTGSGTLASSVALTASGRSSVTFVPASGEVYAAARITRTSGTAEVYDFGLRQGAMPRPNICEVSITNFDMVSHTADGKRATISLTLSEV